MSREAILGRVSAYYTATFARSGCTPAGVDWPSESSQRVRFRQLLRIRDGEEAFEVNDYGSGFGALADYLHACGVEARYRGYDVSEPMIEAARTRHRGCGCAFMTDPSALTPAAYTVASGIFNVTADTPAGDWRTYVLETLEEMAALTRRAFAFNVLSSAVAVERRRPHLYYADPMELWAHCRRRFSPRVALLHDYWPHEFTVIVRLTDE